MAQLERLTPVDLHEAWINEARDFTPWLAREENIGLLADTIGLELEVEAQEQRVGPFRADILCREKTPTANPVLIENQLDWTDHTHLGQLLTYAAGLRAVTIVWVAARFTDEHRAALDWLNDITDESVNFFGLEIELWQIGDSLPAPKFNVVCKPNDWPPDTSEGLGEARKFYLEYWTAFRDVLAQRAGPVKPTKPCLSPG